MHRLLLVAVATATLTLAPSIESGPNTRVAEPDGRLAYSSRFWPKDWRIVDNWEIFLLKVGGNRSVNITRHPRCDEVSPAWSRDGRWIAFACGWGPSAGIAVIRDDGTRRRVLVRRPNRRPEGVAWSGDDRRLAFVDKGIWVVNADGKGLRRLTRGDDISPTWSSDSRTIAFERTLRGVRRVYQMRPDGTGQHRIAERASTPAWSPDGSTIAFIRRESLWLMDRNGGNQRRAPGVQRSGVTNVTWSPDSRHLAYEFRGRPAEYGVHVIAVDGSGRRHVLWAADPPLGFAWGPTS